MGAVCLYDIDDTLRQTNPFLRFSESRDGQYNVQHLALLQERQVTDDQLKAQDDAIRPSTLPKVTCPRDDGIDILSIEIFR